MDHDTIYEELTDGATAHSILSSLASVPERYLEFAEDAGFSMGMTKTILYALFRLKTDAEHELGERLEFWHYSKPDFVAIGDHAAKYNFVLYVANALYVIQMMSKLFICCAA